MHASSRGRYRPKTLAGSACSGSSLERVPARLGARHRLADELEVGAHEFRQARERELRDVVHQPVRGEDGEPRVAQAAQVDHERVGAEVPHRPALVAVGQRRLVAVVAVGDVDGPLPEPLGHAAGGGAGERGEAVRVAVAVVRLAPGGGGQLGRRRVQVAAHGAVVVREQQEDLADVGVQGAVEPQAVDLGTLVRALVREHDSFVESGEPEPRDEPPAGALAAVRPRVHLVDDHDAGQLVADERSFLAPAAERRRRPRVGLVVGLGPGRDGQVDVGGVVGAARPKLGRLGRGEHVVRRRDDVVERDARAVAEASEGRDVGHRSPRGGRAHVRYPGSL